MVVLLDVILTVGEGNTETLTESVSEQAPIPATTE
jgi:hypothetical protein